MSETVITPASTTVKSDGFEKTENEFLRFFIRFGIVALLTGFLILGAMHFQLSGKVGVLEDKVKSFDTIKESLATLQQRIADSDTAVQRLDDRTVKITDIEVSVSGLHSTDSQFQLAINDNRTDISELKNKVSAADISLGKFETAINTLHNRGNTVDGDREQIKRDVHSICERLAKMEGKLDAGHKPAE